MHNVNQELYIYIKENVESLYKNFYAHGQEHINNVIRQSFLIAKDYDVNLDMVYTIACYHDIGLLKGRNNHAKSSGEYLYKDEKLRQFFNEEQLLIMKEAIEDHSGSRKIPPRNIYGKIVSDADRDTNLETLAIRQIATSLKNYPELKTFEEHFERSYNYTKDNKFKEKEFHLWCRNEQMIAELKKFAVDFLNKDYAKEIYFKAYKHYEDNNLIDKIKNSYFD